MEHVITPEFAVVREQKKGAAIMQRSEHFMHIKREVYIECGRGAFVWNRTQKRQ